MTCGGARPIASDPGRRLLSTPVPPPKWCRDMPRVQEEMKEDGMLKRLILIEERTFED